MRTDKSALSLASKRSTLSHGEPDGSFGLEAPTGPCYSLLEEREPADGLRCPTTRLGARRLLERPADAVLHGVGRDE